MSQPTLCGRHATVAPTNDQPRTATETKNNDDNFTLLVVKSHGVSVEVRVESVTLPRSSVDLLVKALQSTHARMRPSLHDVHCMCTSCTRAWPRTAERFLSEPGKSYNANAAGRTHQYVCTYVNTVYCFYARVRTLVVIILFLQQAGSRS